MEHSIEIKKLDYFYTSKNAEIILQGILTCHMESNFIKKLKNSKKVQPISVINKIPKHKRTIYGSSNKLFPIQEIPDTYFVSNMLKINNKLYFTSFNGGILMNQNLIGCLDNSMTYSYCLSNIIYHSCNCKNDNDILKYNKNILTTFWQTQFGYILNDTGYNKKYNLKISELLFRVINTNINNMETSQLIDQSYL